MIAGSVVGRPLGCYLCLLLVLLSINRLKVSARSIEQCAAFQELYPTIYEQLTPFLGGISQHQVDLAAKYVARLGKGYEPSLADLKYNSTAAETLAPEDPDFPWSHPFFVKLVIKDGEIYLPGGRIPPNREGFSFTRQWASGHLLLDILNASDAHGPFPDMEFFVTSGDFQAVGDLSEDGTTFPTLSSSGSKRFYDLVLPEFTTTQEIQEPKHIYEWSERTNKVMGRYNLMCHRGGASIHLRGPPKKPTCVRAEFHELNRSDKNHDGIIDVGLVGWTPDWVQSEATNWADPKDLARAKFALCIDGGTTANRLPALLKGGQLVMLEQTSPLFSHFYAAMQPWVHYVPIGRDSYDDIFDIARFLVANDDLARSIAEAGQAFAQKYLVREASDCYTKKMLEALGSLVKYPLRPLPPQAITLRQAVELVEADRIWMLETSEPEDR